MAYFDLFLHKYDQKEANLRNPVWLLFVFAGTNYAHGCRVGGVPMSKAHFLVLFWFKIVQDVDTFWCFCSRWLLNALWQKEKLLIMRNFCFCHNGFPIYLVFSFYLMFSKLSAASLLKGLKKLLNVFSDYSITFSVTFYCICRCIDSVWSWLSCYVLQDLWWSLYMSKDSQR